MKNTVRRKTSYKEHGTKNRHLRNVQLLRIDLTENSPNSTKSELHKPIIKLPPLQNPGSSSPYATRPYTDLHKYIMTLWITL